MEFRLNFGLISALRPAPEKLAKTAGWILSANNAP
jgi:hypothetical protein